MWLAKTITLVSSLVIHSFQIYVDYESEFYFFEFGFDIGSVAGVALAIVQRLTGFNIIP